MYSAKLAIGPYVFIGKNCTVRASQIGSNCVIGSGSIVVCSLIMSHCALDKFLSQGAGACLKDGCIVMPGTIVPDNTTLAPFMVYGGTPCVLLRDVGHTELEEYASVFKHRVDRFSRELPDGGIREGELYFSDDELALLRHAAVQSASTDPSGAAEDAETDDESQFDVWPARCLAAISDFAGHTTRPTGIEIHIPWPGDTSSTPECWGKDTTVLSAAAVPTDGPGAADDAGAVDSSAGIVAARARSKRPLTEADVMFLSHKELVEGNRRAVVLNSGGMFAEEAADVRAEADR